MNIVLILWLGANFFIKVYFIDNTVPQLIIKSREDDRNYIEYNIHVMK